VISILLIGFTSSALIYQHFQDLQESGMIEVFRTAAEERFATVKEVIELDTNILVAVKGLYNASDAVDRYEFLVFTKTFVKAGSAFQALAWVPIVPEADLQTFTNATIQEGFKDYHVTSKDALGNFIPSGQQEFYLPIHFVEPFTHTKRLIGYDLSTDPVINEAILRARESNDLSISGRIQLDAQMDARYSVLAILPVHSKKTFAKAPANYAEYTEGYVVGSFLLGNIFEKSIRLLKPQGLNVALFDVTGGSEPQFLYGQFSRLSPQAGRVMPEQKYDDVIRQDFVKWFDWSVGGRRWRLVYNATDAFINHHRRWEAGYYFFIGCIITIITALLFFRSFQQTAQVKKEVEKRTRELNAANSDLEQKIKIISEQNEDLENIKKATLNILEDLEVSKKELERMNHILGDQKQTLEKVNL
ncbi:MAG: CHASE domain-containing protein, partial [Candidatus Omnitrophica bacterium]|nr:CHASE domain-containing protein [Candidatus Omnitrophota bacterium]